MADRGKDFHPMEAYSNIQEHENVLMLISDVNTLLTRRLRLVFWLKNTVSVLMSTFFLFCFDI